MKKWWIKRIDELNDDELDKFYCKTTQVYNNTTINLYF